MQNTTPYLLAVLWLTLSSFSAAQERLFGVNLAGADFGASQDNITNFSGHGSAYIYPNQTEVDYFMSKDMNVIRLPFRWERLQPTLNAEFDPDELRRLTEFVNATTAKGVHVILDPHNYARYRGNIIGSSALPYEMFYDFWDRLSRRFQSNPLVIFGLMNEPSRMRTDHWRIAANTGIEAIRDNNATNLILVPGNGWTGGHSWLKNFYADESPNSGQIGPNGYRVGSNAEEMLNIVDPLNNFMFDIHQYLDSDFAGVVDFCVSETIGVETLQEVTAWLKRHNHKGFLGEFGGGRGQTCLNALRNMTTFMNDNPDQWIGWSYWAAGPWWGEYFSTLEPLNLNSGNPIDRPQLAALVFTPSKLAPVPPSITFQPSQNRVEFLSNPTLDYRVQSTTNLNQPSSWTDFGGTTQGTGGRLTLAIPPRQSSERSRFYRVEATTR